MNCSWRHLAFKETPVPVSNSKNKLKLHPQIWIKVSYFSMLFLPAFSLFLPLQKPTDYPHTIWAILGVSHLVRTQDFPKN